MDLIFLLHPWVPMEEMVVFVAVTLHPLCSLRIIKCLFNLFLIIVMKGKDLRSHTRQRVWVSVFTENFVCTFPEIAWSSLFRFQEKISSFFFFFFPELRIMMLLGIATYYQALTLCWIQLLPHHDYIFSLFPFSR